MACDYFKDYEHEHKWNDFDRDGDGIRVLCHFFELNWL